MSDSDRLAELLARYAYQEGEFTLSSGTRSSFYLDAKQVTYRPEGMRLVGAEVYRVARDHGAQAVGGLTLGADAIVAGTVLASVDQAPMPGFIVRKAQKQHGLGKWIEGVDPRGRRAVIVEDVLTTGESALAAVARAQEAGATVALVVALVDREQGGADRVRAEGVYFHAICTLSGIREAYARGAAGHRPGTTSG